MLTFALAFVLAFVLHMVVVVVVVVVIVVVEVEVVALMMQMFVVERYRVHLANLVVGCGKLL